MNKCEDFQRLISDWHDAPLAPENERLVEEHLSGCPNCREFAAAIATIRAQIGLLPEPQPANSVTPKQRETVLWRRRLALPIPVAAALLLVAISGWVVALLMPEPTSRAADPVALVRSVEIITLPAAPVLPLGPDGTAPDNKEDSL